MNVLLGLIGAGLVVGGVAVIYWPAAMILAGMFFIRAYLNLEKANAGRTK